MLPELNVWSATIFYLLPLASIVAAVVGTGWIASRTLDAKVDAIKSDVASIRDAVKSDVASIRDAVKAGTEEHKQFRSEIVNTNKRLDDLFQHLLNASKQ